MWIVIPDYYLLTLPVFWEVDSLILLKVMEASYLEWLLW